MSRLHALLIGIDGYEPNAVFGTKGYPPLHGCVRDVEAVEAYLRDEFDMPAERILKLIAPADGEPTGSPELAVRRPTYEGMVGAFELLMQKAAPGEQVYVHYAGHGGLVTTLWPKIKTTWGCDETFVPMNVGSPEARHLRDVELNFLLRRMVDGGLTVTLVLDCCHSGGALREFGEKALPPNPPGAWARGIPCCDPTTRSAESLVGSQAELGARLEEKAPAGTRGGAPRSYLRAPDDWVVLAACREDERAYEIEMEGEGKRGAFTSCWLDGLRQAARGVTYHEVFEPVRAQVRGLRPARRDLQQTPQLLGAGDRVAFGKKHLPSRSSVRVVEVRGDRLVLDTGAIHAIAKRARFALFPDGTEEDDPQARLGEAEITHLGSATSRALIRIVGEASRPIVAGDKATLLDPGALRLQSAIRVKAASERAPKAHQKALDLLAKELAASGTGFLHLARESEAPHYTVWVDERGRFAVGNPWGEAIPFPVVPSLAVTEAQAASRFAKRLVHLAKFRNVAGLPRPTRSSLLEGQLGLAWVGLPAGTTPRVRAGDELRLEISNRSSRDVFIAAVSMRSDGSIQTVSLGGERAAAFRMKGRFERQPAGQVRELAVPIRRCEGQTRAHERLRVFALLQGEANFQWLELPPWDGRPLPRPAWRADDPLALLFSALAWEAKPRVVVEANPRQEWTFETLELEIEA